MTLETVISTGSGSLAARLEIEGLAIQIVTDPGMEQTDADGRRRVYCATLFGGDDSWGFVIDESVNIPEAVLESTGTTARLFETDAEDLAQTFSFGPDVTRFVTAKVSSSATTINMLSTTGITAGDVVHIGTEAILVGTVGASSLTGCTRAYWGTIAQAHWTIGDADGIPWAVLTNRPLRTRGRRARLYLYGDGDDLTGDGGNSGSPVWRGFVTAEPRCDERGTSWSISLGPLTKILESKLGGELENPMVPRGIYYSWAAPLRVAIAEQVTAGAMSEFTPKLFDGFYETQIAFVDALTTWLTSEFSALASSFRAIETADGRWTIEATVGSGRSGVAVWIWSHQDGQTSDRAEQMQFADGTNAGDLGALTPGDVVYPRWTGRPAGGGLVPRGYFGEPDTGIGADGVGLVPRVSSDAATYPDQRVYLAGSVTTDWQSVTAEWSDTISRAGEVYDIEARSTTTNYVDLGPRRVREVGAPDDVHLYTPQSLPQFRPLRLLATGSVDDFRDALVVESVEYANRGTAPFVTSADLADWSPAVARIARLPWQLRRHYPLASSVDLAEMIANELRLLGAFMITDSTGKIALAPIQVPTDVAAAAADIDDEIISVGWSSIETGNQTINRVSLQTGYDPLEDDWAGRTIDAQDATSYAQDHQDRPLLIEPRSTALSGDALITGEEVAAMALPVLSLFGYPHQFAHVNVSWKLFDLRLGDVVTFSADHLPSYTTGLRPISSARGVVVGRKWAIGDEAHGELTILLSWANVAGYSPTARITGQSNPAADRWILTVNPTLYAPTSPADGSVIANVGTFYAAGDRVRVVRFDATSATPVLGTVLGTSPGTNQIEVDFDATWTPSTHTWELIFAPYTDASIQAGQKLYAALAGADAVLGASDEPRTYGA